MTLTQHIKASFILTALFFSYQATAQTDTKTKQIQQLQALVAQIDQSYARSNEKVYLSTKGVQTNIQIETLNTYTKQLTDFLKTMQTHQAEVSIPNLKWISADNAHPPKTTLVNAALNGNASITICRASFIGNNVLQTASYPGQLTPTGCRISYAGYAFIMSKYDVLSGNNTGLEWVSIKEIKKNTPPRNADQVSPLEYHQPNKPFKFDITINNSSPVVGGFVGNEPVLICRATYNNLMTLGKVVFFFGNRGFTEDACDIGIDDKEIVIHDGYDVLFWKKT